MNSDALSYTIPVARPGLYKIRLRLSNDGLCKEVIHAPTIFEFTVMDVLGFYYTNQPELRQYICKGSDFSTFIGYAGDVDETKSY
jgi:hypothetical protein